MLWRPIDGMVALTGQTVLLRRELADRAPVRVRNRVTALDAAFAFVLKTDPVHVLVNEVIGKLRDRHVVENTVLGVRDPVVGVILIRMADLVLQRVLDLDPEVNSSVRSIALQQSVHGRRGRCQPAARIHRILSEARNTVVLGVGAHRISIFRIVQNLLGNCHSIPQQRKPSGRVVTSLLLYDDLQHDRRR